MSTKFNTNAWFLWQIIKIMASVKVRWQFLINPAELIAEKYSADGEESKEFNSSQYMRWDLKLNVKSRRKVNLQIERKSAKVWNSRAYGNYF